MELRIAQRAMIRVQPERQEKYEGDETAGTRVFGRTDRDNRTGFAAKPDSGYGVFRDGRDRLEADTNGAKGGCAGNQPDRRVWDDDGVCGVPETHEARVVDCCRSDFRNDGGSHGSDAHVRAGQKRRGEAAGTSDTRSDPGKLDRVVRLTGGRRDERNVSRGATDNELQTRRERKNRIRVQQDGRGKERLGVSVHERPERNQELRNAGSEDCCAAVPGFDEVNALTPKNSKVKQFEHSASEIRR